MIINHRRILKNRLDTNEKETLQFKVSFVASDKGSEAIQFEPLIIQAKSEHAAWNQALLRFGSLYPEIDTAKIEVRVCRDLSLTE